MPKYYESRTPGLLKLFAWDSTLFALVLVKREFWCYMVVHIIMVIAAKLLIEDGAAPPIRWEAAATMQYFLTFFTTFYNDKCYTRYMEQLYPYCNEFADSVVHFMTEMNVSLHYASLRKHRTAAAKYMLAAVHEYYMVLTGGKLASDDWKDLTRHGLLTHAEATMMSRYPGDQCHLLLTSWTLFIIRDALMQDDLWMARSEQTVHVYNRLDQHVKRMLKSCHAIGFLMAMPVPFVYYHLMSLTCVCNIFVIALIPALLKSWFTVPFFALATLMIMGVKEIASSLADPFGREALDLPIGAFLKHAFDRIACLLVSFLTSDDDIGPRATVLENVNDAQEFLDIHLRRGCDHDVLYDGERKMKSHGVFAWSRPAAIEETDPEEKLGLALENSFVKGEYQRISGSRNSGMRSSLLLQHSEELQVAEDQLADERSRGEDLRFRILDYKRELEALRAFLLNAPRVRHSLIMA